MSDSRSQSNLLTLEERKKQFPQLRCPMLEIKDGFSLPDSDTPQCTGKPECDAPNSLTAYFQSVHFGRVKVCNWHSQLLISKEGRYLSSFRMSFGEDLSRRNRLILEARCWHPLVKWNLTFIGIQLTGKNIRVCVVPALQELLPLPDWQGEW